LVVEDEKKVAGFLRRGLEEEGYSVDCAYDGEEALRKLRDRSYDLVILDIMLPKVDGMQVLKEMRETGIRTPVLMLTAKDAVEDVVKGLDSGADDYLTKPFAFEELLARIRALLRRKEGETELRVGDLVLDVKGRKAKRGDREVELTTKEFALLEYLMRHPGRVLSREEIAEAVWGERHGDTNIVDVYINHLRKKIDQGFPTRLIHTVRGVGYSLRA